MNETTNFWTSFMPHGHCYLWRPDILWLNVISDGVIALAYLSIPFGLFVVLRKRPNTQFRGLLTMFSLFILACGVTHFISIWTVWNGDYGIHGISKGITGLISIATASMLLPKLPQLTAYKSPEELEALNRELQSQIAEYRRSTQKLESTEKKLKAFVDQSPDGILTTTEAGDIDYANSMVQKLFGYTSEELQKMVITDLVPHKDHDSVGTEVNFSLTDETDGLFPSSVELTGLHKQGTEFPIELRVSPIKLPNGKGYLTTLRDISARKKAEEANRKHFEQLAHVSRLNTVGQMAAGLAHELNQPLTAITGNLHTAMAMQKQKEIPDPFLLEMMQENYESALRAGQIIKSLRQLVQKNDGNRESADINELISTCKKVLQPEATANHIEVYLNLEESIPRVLVDVTQLQQVVVNLARNSIESLSETKRRNKVLMLKTTLKAEHQIIVEVSDTGPGLNKEVKSKLFQPYITTKAEGMGLGLSICKTIVEAHGGELWHDDTVRSGTTFCFTIPCNAGQSGGQSE